MIRREPEAETAKVFDVIVVGAGIHGVAAALEATRRGLHVLVLDRGDFGGETSWNSLRVLHGGLRYLQTLDLARFRESVRARSWYVREFPTLVRPLACLMPLYGKGLRRKATLRPVLALNEMLRRIWADAGERDLISGSQILTEGEVAARFPGVRSAGLRGGALWYDAILPQPQRVLMEMLRRMTASGGVALNYVEAIGFDVEGGVLGGVQIRDQMTAGEFSLRSRVVLNCAGPWAEDLVSSIGSASDTGYAPSLAFNLLLDRPLNSKYSVAVEPAGGGRTYFLHPRGQTTMVGTYHASADIPGTGPTEEQILAFLADVTAALPEFQVTREDVLRVLPGTLPARRAGTNELATSDLWIDAGKGGGPDGLFTLVGVKYTTAPMAAKRAVDQIMERYFPESTRSSVRNPVEPKPRSVPDWPVFARFFRDDPRPALALLKSIIIEESVTSVDDLLLRRTDWGLAPKDYVAAAALVAEFVPDLLNLEG